MESNSHAEIGHIHPHRLTFSHHMPSLASSSVPPPPAHYCWPTIVTHHSHNHSPVSEDTASSSGDLRRRKRKVSPVSDEIKDEAYWERRRKNNESAKRSRELRRSKEQHTGARVVVLEQENLKLKAEVETLREEIGRLTELMFNHGRRRRDD